MAAAYQLNIQVSDRTIDSHIRNIRAKLAAVNCDNVIETIHGVGFKLGALRAAGMTELPSTREMAAVGRA